MTTLPLDPRIARLASGIVQIDLLYACDLNCTHCYLSVRQAKGMDTQRYFDLIDEVHEAGFFQLLFSGGEIFLRKDILDILRYARNKRMLVKLITHAGRITDEIADVLAEIGIHMVGVSLYSMVAADHEAVTRVPGSHAKTIAGVERLRARGVSVNLKVPIMHENAKSWASVLTWGDKLGCITNASSVIMAKDDLDVAHIDAMNVDFVERVAIEARLLQKRLDDGKTWERAPESAMNEGLCGAAHFAGYVDPYGKVFPCAVFYEAAGDLAESSFMEIWDDSPLMQKIRGTTKASLAACQGCDFILDCSHCLAMNLQHTGDMHTRSPLLCATTHARFTAAHEMGLHDQPVSLPDDLFGLQPAVRRPPCSIDGAGNEGEACGDSGCGPSPAPSSSSFDIPSILELAQQRA